MGNLGGKVWEHLLQTIVVFGAIILVLVVIVKWLTALDECHDKKGVLVNTFFGYACVEPKK